MRGVRTVDIEREASGPKEGGHVEELVANSLDEAHIDGWPRLFLPQYTHVPCDTTSRHVLAVPALGKTKESAASAHRGGLQPASWYWDLG